MEAKESKKIRELVFERLVCGEDADQLRAQLKVRLNDEEVESLVAEALSRIELGRGSDEFSASVRKIRKRRLVGARYSILKFIAGFLIFIGVTNGLAMLLSGEKIIGSFVGLFIGGIILAFVELQERKIIEPEM